MDCGTRRQRTGSIKYIQKKEQPFFELYQAMEEHEKKMKRLNILSMDLEEGYVKMPCGEIEKRVLRIQEEQVGLMLRG